MPPSSPSAPGASSGASSGAHASVVPLPTMSPIVPAPDAATMPDPADALARVQAFADDAFRTLSDATHTLADQAGRLSDDSQQFVREHPGSTLGGAFAVGVAIGVLFGVRS